MGILSEESNHASLSRSMAMRAEKKLVGSLAGRAVVSKYLVDDTTTDLLDHLHHLLSAFYNKKTADKTVKNIIKLCVKVAVLYRKDQFNEHERIQLSQFEKGLRQMLLTIVSFHSVAFSYDSLFLCSQTTRLRDTLHQLIRPHLTDKSCDRLPQVFAHLAHDKFTDSMFAKEAAPQMDAIVMNIHTILEQKH